MVRIGEGGKIDSPTAELQKLSDKADHISLNRKVLTTPHELGSPTWTDAIDIQKILTQILERFLRAGIIKQGDKSRGNVVDPLAVVL